jgi:hypothetical protein
MLNYLIIKKVYKMKNELIFLLHGIYMHPMLMTKFSRELENSGYIVKNIYYNSTNINKETIFDIINEEIKIHSSKKIHFVGYSLGGLIIRHYLNEYVPKNLGNVVTIGTPHQTSSTAKRVERLKFGFILGNSKKNGLIEPLKNDKWILKNKLGVISGTRDLGARTILFPEEKNIISDGFVTLDESKLEGAADEIEFHLNHLSLIYSLKVMAYTIKFLKYGHFHNNEMDTNKEIESSEVSLNI